MPVRAETAPTIFVIDGDRSIAKSVEATIREQGWKVTILQSVDQFLALGRAPMPSCLVLDLDLPELDASPARAQLDRAVREGPVVFIAGDINLPTAVRAIKCGAVDVLTRPIDNRALLCAIEEAISISQNTLTEQAELASVRQQCATLSKRERDVLSLIVTGLLNKQVGFELGICEATVKAHRGQVMRKMNARTFVDLVNKAALLDLGSGGSKLPILKPWENRRGSRKSALLLIGNVMSEAQGHVH